MLKEYDAKKIQKKEFLNQNNYLFVAVFTKSKRFICFGYHRELQQFFDMGETNRE